MKKFLLIFAFVSLAFSREQTCSVHHTGRFKVVIEAAMLDQTVRPQIYW